ncbi:MAG TPA: JAB domain-containing protein [Gammaproteobacteria bacterium]|nr:JAB domain-containing protein [Gammaproteobacteria bacterium]
MAITDWPAEERPREKLLQRGSVALTDAELLAIFLRVGIPGKSAVDLARELLDYGGGLRGLLEMDIDEFCSFKGMGEAKYAQLQAVIEMASRHLREQLQRGEAFTSPELTRHYLQQKLRDYPYEVFACLYLDTRHRLISYDELFRGTIDGASVHPREVVRKSLEHNAAAVILAHNHPSGVAEPSDADCRITLRLRDALGLVDVRVLDHIVVGDETVSMAERGLI